MEILEYALISIKKRFEDAVQHPQEYGYKKKLSFDVFYNVLRVINVSEIGVVKLSVISDFFNYINYPFIGTLYNFCIELW